MAQTNIDLDIAPAYIERLIIKLRGLEGREGVVDPESGSNPADDNNVDILQMGPGDLSAQEITKEIQGLNVPQQIELVAIMWIGRGDAEPEEWNEVLRLAGDSRDAPTASYLLGNPLAAEYLAEGLDKLGLTPEVTNE